jgi:hypothetical protein
MQDVQFLRARRRMSAGQVNDSGTAREREQVLSSADAGQRPRCRPHGRRPVQRFGGGAARMVPYCRSRNTMVFMRRKRCTVALAVQAQDRRTWIRVRRLLVRRLRCARSWRPGSRTKHGMPGLSRPAANMFSRPAERTSPFVCPKTRCACSTTGATARAASSVRQSSARHSRST